MLSDRKSKSSKGKDHAAHRPHKKHHTSARRDGEPSNSNSNSNFDTSAVSTILGSVLETRLKSYEDALARVRNQKENLSYTYTSLQAQNITKELNAMENDLLLQNRDLGSISRIVRQIKLANITEGQDGAKKYERQLKQQVRMMKEKEKDGSEECRRNRRV